MTLVIFCLVCLLGVWGSYKNHRAAMNASQEAYLREREAYSQEAGRRAVVAAAADKLAAVTERQIAENRAAMVKLPSVLGFEEFTVPEEFMSLVHREFRKCIADDRVRAEHFAKVAWVGYHELGWRPVGTPYSGVSMSKLSA